MTPFEQALGESRKEKPQEQHIHTSFFPTVLFYKSGMNADPLQQNYNIHGKMSLDTQTSKRQEVIATARGSMALVGGVLHQCAVVSLKKE